MLHVCYFVNESCSWHIALVDFLQLNFGYFVIINGSNGGPLSGGYLLARPSLSWTCVISYNLPMDTVEMWSSQRSRAIDPVGSVNIACANWRCFWGLPTLSESLSWVILPCTVIISHSLWVLKMSKMDTGSLLSSGSCENWKAYLVACGVWMKVMSFTTILSPS